MAKDKKFLDFEVLRDTGKTKVFAVKSIEHRIQLGTIAWYGAWRKYVFFPGTDTLFDAICLGEVQSFIGNLMAERRKK